MRAPMPGETAHSASTADSNTNPWRLLNDSGRCSDWKDRKADTAGLAVEFGMESEEFAGVELREAGRVGEDGLELAVSASSRNRPTNAAWAVRLLRLMLSCPRCSSLTTRFDNDRRRDWSFGVKEIGRAHV